MPIFDIDEYKLFKDLFENLKKTDYANLNKIIEALSSQEKEDLKEILSTCYVSTDQNISIPRRILKVKY